MYRAGVASDVPDGTDAGLVEAMRDTLGGATDAVAELPVELANQLLEIAQDAFGRGLRVTATVSAVIAVVAAVGSSYLLRDVPAGAHVPDTVDEGSGTEASTSS